MNFNSFGTWKIIDPEIYQNNDLESLIEELCNPMMNITYKDIANVLVKFFLAYIYPESTNLKVPLVEIEELFSTAEELIASNNKELNQWRKVPLYSNDADIQHQLKCISENYYWLAMICDAAPSIVIFKDVVDHIVDANITEKSYYGLDLGSGSWWLHLAQYIQARRNGFTQIENHWIELNETGSLRANILANKLQTWKIIHWDSTTSGIYNKLPQSAILNHLSNENLPTTDIEMNGKHDPFHENNKTIFTDTLKWRITENTTFFPREISMEVRLWNFHQKLNWIPENGFWFVTLDQMEEWVRQKVEKWFFQFPTMKKWSIYKTTYLESLSLWDRLEKIPQPEIWKELLWSQLKPGIINRPSWFIRRWDDD